MPIAARSQPAIDTIADLFESGREDSSIAPLVLDLGCGTGVASREAAARDSQTVFVGVDRSRDRLERGARGRITPPNAHLLRADMDEVLAAAVRREWTFSAVWLLYPNPWPKPGDLDRRFYARGALADVVRITRVFEARTNWGVYARELVHALATLGVPRKTIEATSQSEPLDPSTAFERKYVDSGHTLWRVRATIDPTTLVPRPSVD
jgi:tRNA G46 methylase TrmB